MRPLTILHVQNSRVVGGIEMSLIGWLRRLDRQRFAARLFCFDEFDGAQNRLLGYVARRNIAAHVLPWGRRKRLAAAVMQLVRSIRASQPCVVHTHDLRPDVVGWLAARLTGSPWIASVHAWHGTWPGLGRKRRWIEAVRARLLTRCDLVVAVSDGVRDESVRRGIDPDRIVVVHTGIGHDDLRPTVARDVMRRALAFDAGDIVIGNVARLHPEKGHSVLLQAFARAHARLPRLRLAIAGEGTLAAPLRAESERLGVSDRVTFLGFQDDLASLLPALDIFALPSLAEGTPLVIYSAMVAGLPIVASDVGGIGELLHDGEDAVLLPPGDAAALADALVRVAGDDAGRLALGLRARDAALHNPRCSIATSTRRLESLYLALVDRGEAAAVAV